MADYGKTPIGELSGAARERAIRQITDRLVSAGVDPGVVEDEIDSTLTVEENVNAIKRRMPTERLPSEKRELGREMRAMNRHKARNEILEKCLEISEESDPTVFDAVLAGAPKPPGISEQRYEHARDVVETIEQEEEINAEVIKEAREACREQYSGPNPASEISLPPVYDAERMTGRRAQQFSIPSEEVSRLSAEAGLPDDPEDLAGKYTSPITENDPTEVPEEERAAILQDLAEPTEAEPDMGALQPQQVESEPEQTGLDGETVGGEAMRARERQQAEATEAQAREAMQAGQESISQATDRASGQQRGLGAAATAEQAGTTTASVPATTPGGTTMPDLEESYSGYEKVSETETSAQFVDQSTGTTVTLTQQPDGTYAYTAEQDGQVIKQDEFANLDGAVGSMTSWMSQKSGGTGATAGATGGAGATSSGGGGPEGFDTEGAREAEFTEATDDGPTTGAPTGESFRERKGREAKVGDEPGFSGTSSGVGTTGNRTDSGERKVATGRFGLERDDATVKEKIMGLAGKARGAVEGTPRPDLNLGAEGGRAVDRERAKEVASGFAEGAANVADTFLNEGQGARADISATDPFGVEQGGQLGGSGAGLDPMDPFGLDDVAGGASRQRGPSGPTSGAGGYDAFDPFGMSAAPATDPLDPFGVEGSGRQQQRQQSQTRRRQQSTGGTSTKRQQAQQAGLGAGGGASLGSGAGGGADAAVGKILYDKIKDTRAEVQYRRKHKNGEITVVRSVKDDGVWTTEAFDLSAAGDMISQPVLIPPQSSSKSDVKTAMKNWMRQNPRGVAPQGGSGQSESGSGQATMAGNAGGGVGFDVGDGFKSSVAGVGTPGSDGGGSESKNTGGAAGHNYKKVKDGSEEIVYSQQVDGGTAIVRASKSDGVWTANAFLQGPGGQSIGDYENIPGEETRKRAIKKNVIRPWMREHPDGDF